VTGERLALVTHQGGNGWSKRPAQVELLLGRNGRIVGRRAAAHRVQAAIVDQLLNAHLHLARRRVQRVRELLTRGVDAARALAVRGDRCVDLVGRDCHGKSLVRVLDGLMLWEQHVDVNAGSRVCHRETSVRRGGGGGHRIGAGTGYWL
jgi:hypothetical protein